MRRNALVFALSGVAVAVAAWHFVPAGTRGSAPPVLAPTGVTTPASASTPPSTPAPAAAAGYVVHFDDNGNIITADEGLPDAAFSAQLEEALSTSQDGLVTLDSPVPGGGVMIDLQGRFQSAAVATVDANGKLVVPCLSNEAEAKAFTTNGAASSTAAKE